MCNTIICLYLRDDIKVTMYYTYLWDFLVVLLVIFIFTCFCVLQVILLQRHLWRLHEILYDILVHYVQIISCLYCDTDMIYMYVLKYGLVQLILNHHRSFYSFSYDFLVYSLHMIILCEKNIKMRWWDLCFTEHFLIIICI
jgi:hypothetical protein